MQTKFKKKKKTVTATDLAKWAGANKLKADQPRFVDAVHKELSEIVAGTLPAQDTNSTHTAGQPNIRFRRFSNFKVIPSKFDPRGGRRR